MLFGASECARPERQRHTILQRYSRAAGASYAEIPPGRRASPRIATAVTVTAVAAPARGGGGARAREEGGRRAAGGNAPQMLAGKDLPAEARKVAEREVNYFQKHKGHMDYAIAPSAA